MGSLLSTSNSQGAQTDQAWASFPPKTGAIFAGHFYLGGEKFESVARDSFIFSESADLQFVNNQPLPYPLPVGRPTGQSRPLRAVVSLRKETARFVKADSGGAEPLPHHAFHVELVLDCLVDCEVSVWLFVRQSFNGQRLVLEPQHPLFPGPERRRFSRGLGQVFSCTELTLRPAVFDEAADSSWQDAIPLAVLCESLDESGPANQQLLLCSAERLSSDSAYSLKVLKQIMVIDGLPLVAHDIYGISDRETGGSQSASAATAVADSLADLGDADCVVCMVKARDTVILPCRHLCLCDACADSLRYQASCCPICRAPFRALLQLTVQTDSSEPSSSAGSQPGTAVSILEFVNARRQSDSAAASASNSAARVSARRPATAAQQAWASPAKPAGKPPQPPAASSRAAARRCSGDSGGRDEDCWADSESDEPPAEAAAAPVAAGDSVAAIFTFPVTETDRCEAASLVVDGDADRGSNSCCSSTESANSQRQLLSAAAAAMAGAVGSAAAPSGSSADPGSNGSAIIISGGGSGGDGSFPLPDSDESDFS